MAFSADAVANYFLDRACAASLPVSPMKLQKLIYFAHGWHLALEKNGHPLLAENEQAWEYGPVLPSVYHEFKDFGDQPITRKATEVEFNEDRGLVLYEPAIDQEAAKFADDIEFPKAVLNRIWNVYSPHPAVQLSEMTHEEGSPWWQVRSEAKRRFRGKIPRGLNIPNELIRN